MDLSAARSSVERSAQNIHYIRSAEYNEHDVQGSASDLDGDNINVVVRVRPISNKEQRNNDEGIIQFPGEGQIWVSERLFSEHLGSFILWQFNFQVDEAKGALKPFTFNVVFEPEATQEDVLEHSGMKR